MESLNINGKTLRLTIQRKPIRNLILRLKTPDELLVSAPYACSTAESCGLSKRSAAGLRRMPKSLPSGRPDRRNPRLTGVWRYMAGRYSCSG